MMRTHNKNVRLHNKNVQPHHEMLLTIALGLLLGGCGPAPLATMTPSWTSLGDPISRDVFGHNSVWANDGLGLWSDAAAAPVPSIVSEVKALAPSLLRFPGGTRAMRYHFADALGPPAMRKPECDPFKGMLDATAYGPDEFFQVADALDVDVTWVAPWVDGTPEEIAALAAWLAGDAATAVPIGVDGNGVDWGDSSSWAQKRAQPSPYARVKWLEIGNEPYLSLAAGPTTSCGRAGAFVQDERWENGVAIPTTARDYAAQLVKTAALVRAIAPSLQIGACATSQYDGTSDAMAAVGDVDAKLDGDPWNARLLSDARAAFDFFILHPYDFSTDDDSRLRLGDRLRKTIHDLRAAAPDKAVAVTEFGFLFGGGTLENALMTADVIRVAIEESLVMNVRHILVENEPNGPFADNAAITAPAGTRAPGYFAAQLMTSAFGGAGMKMAPLAGVSDGQLLADDTLVGFAAGDGTNAAVMILDRRLADSAPTRLVRVTLPRAGMTVAETVVSGGTLDATTTSLLMMPLGNDGESVDVDVPAHSLLVLTARPR
jgi:hypothetical protein